MDNTPATDRNDLSRPLRPPIVLTPEEVKEVAGGLNPQPLLPRADIDS